MRHDRYGDLIDDDTQDDRPHRCSNGWIDRNADHPVPCLVCKPHLDRSTDDESREESP